MGLALTELDMVRQKLSDEWNHDFEQTAERVVPYMTLETGLSGDYYEEPMMSGTEMTEYTGSRVNMVESRLKYGKRGMRYRKFYNYQTLSVDEADDMMAIAVKAGHVKVKQKAAAAREMDEIALGVIKDAETGLYRPKRESDGGFLGGILGTNYGGDGGLTKYDLNTAYPTESLRTNLVPVDYSLDGTPGVSSNFGATVYARIDYVKRLLSENEAFDGTSPGDICMIISPAEKQLLSAYEVGLNHNYGFSRLSETGPTYNEHLNVTFIVSNMLPKMDTVDKNGTAVKGCTMCAAWLKSQVKFGIWRNPEWTIQHITGMADVDYGIRVRGKAGAMRLREDAVFVMPVVSI